MNSILELAHRKNLLVVEDCAQAQGARYHGKAVGSFGHVAAFSFCQDKIMTTGGEGGMLVTNDSTMFGRGGRSRIMARTTAPCTQTATEVALASFIILSAQIGE